MGKKKKKGEAKSTEDEGTDIPSSNTRSGKSYGSAVDDDWKLDAAERQVQLGKLMPFQYGVYLEHRPATVATAILRVPGYGSSKLDDVDDDDNP